MYMGEDERYSFRSMLPWARYATINIYFWGVTGDWKRIIGVEGRGGQ